MTWYFLNILTFAEGTGWTSEVMLTNFEVDLEAKLRGCGTGRFFLVSSDEDKDTFNLGLGIGSAK